MKKAEPKTETALVVSSERQIEPRAPETPMSPGQLLERVRMIHEIMRTVMKEGKDFGTIQGCGEEKVLKKPGAEKLACTFHIRPAFEVEVVELERGHREYRVCCRLYSMMTDRPIGEANAVCSTMEDKYRYRVEWMNRPVPKEYWDSRDPDLIGGQSYEVRKAKGQWKIILKKETEPANFYNTALRMGEKRAFVGAIRLATGASDIFSERDDDADPQTDPNDPGYQPGEEPQRETKPQETAGRDTKWSDVLIVGFGDKNGKRLGDVPEAFVRFISQQKPGPEEMKNEALLRMWKAAKDAVKDFDAVRNEPAN